MSAEDKLDYQLEAEMIQPCLFHQKSLIDLSLNTLWIRKTEEILQKLIKRILYWKYKLIWSVFVIKNSFSSKQN